MNQLFKMSTANKPLGRRFSKEITETPNGADLILFNDKWIGSVFIWQTNMRTSLAEYADAIKCTVRRYNAHVDPVQSSRFQTFEEKMSVLRLPSNLNSFDGALSDITLNDIEGYQTQLRHQKSLWK